MRSAIEKLKQNGFEAWLGKDQKIKVKHYWGNDVEWLSTLEDMEEVELFLFCQTLDNTQQTA